MDEWELTELVARVGCLYTKRGLCPPSRLRDAAKHWLGLSHDEIIEVIEQHFDAHRGLYTSGSGDAYFNLVEQGMRRAWERKHPSIARAGDPVPSRKRGRVKKLYRGAGFTEAFDDSDEPWIHRTMPPRSTSPPRERISPDTGLEDD
jgi:hypothetical protein